MPADRKSAPKRGQQRWDRVVRMKGDRNPETGNPCSGQCFWIKTLISGKSLQQTVVAKRISFTLVLEKKFEVRERDEFTRVGSQCYRGQALPARIAEEMIGCCCQEIAPGRIMFVEAVIIFRSCCQLIRARVVNKEIGVPRVVKQGKRPIGCRPGYGDQLAN